MKFRIIILTLFIFFASILNVFSQVTLSTRLGLSTLSEIQLEVTSPLDKDNSIYTSIGYAYRSFNLTGPSCGTLWPSPLLNKKNKGFNFKLGFIQSKTKVKRDKTKIRNHTFAVFYRKLNGETRESEFVNESGCGTSPNFYNYEYTLNDMGFSYINSGDLSKALSFYWSVSAGQRFQKRKNLSTVVITPETEKKDQGFFLLDLGFRLKLTQIGKTKSD